MSDEPQPDEDTLYFNGVNGATGEFGLPPMSHQALSELLQGDAPPENLDELRFRAQQEDQAHFGLKEGVDPKKLDEAGWGIVFAHDADPQLLEALGPLIELRRAQAKQRFQLYDKANGYRRGESKSEFLARHKMGPGPADPAKVPYYLLIIGGPEQIPYRFQSQLDVQYAVGRLHFETLDEYANYAASVVEAETKGVRLPRKLRFFGVGSEADKATELSTTQLVAPLCQYLEQQRPDWDVRATLREHATKSALASLLGGEATPALLFTASHGLEFPNGDARQRPHQGALLCSDWPGPKAWRGKGPIPQDFYFAGDDLGADANLLGLISFFFACYGGGTPKLDEFAKQAFADKRAELAPHSFVAALPNAMLSRPRGGALAVIGHVERAWACSFRWQGAGAQTAVFESVIDRLLDGHPVGSAMEPFNQRYAELSSMLTDQLEEIEYGAEPNPYELIGMWTANNDARGYMVLGDPAVRMPTAAVDEQEDERPTLELRSRDISSTKVTLEPDKQADTAPTNTAISDSELREFTVTTFATPDPTAPDRGRVVAQTHVRLDGDIESHLSSEPGDQPRVRAHEELVKEALRARVAYIELLVGKP
jgi:hypothetical protein